MNEPIWDYSRNQQRHTWSDDQSRNDFQVVAVGRGHGYVHRPKIDGYNLRRVPYGAYSPIFIEHGTSVKELKIKAVQASQRIVLAEARERRRAQHPPMTKAMIILELKKLGWKRRRKHWASPHYKRIFQQLTLREAATHEFLEASESLS